MALVYISAAEMVTILNLPSSCPLAPTPTPLPLLPVLTSQLLSSHLCRIPCPSVEMYFKLITGMQIFCTFCNYDAAIFFLDACL